MADRGLKSGYTLVELLVVVSIAALITGLGLPAARNVIKSFESADRTYDVIAAAFSSARAIAIKDAKYTGVRFQQDKEGNQYMIFIQHDPAGTNLANGFRPVTGRNPIRLPKNGMVMDLHLREDTINNTSNPLSSAYVKLDTDSEINSDVKVTDATTFSVVFSPAGKLIIHEVRARYLLDNSYNIIGADDIFNDASEVDSGRSMFYRDNYPNKGFGQEVSRNHFIIVDKIEFNKVPEESRWTDYLQYLNPIYINPYSGELID